MGKEDHETWTSTVILGSPAETFRARRTHVMFLGRFMVVVTGTGWQVGQCIIRPFGLEGPRFPVAFQCAPKNPHFSSSFAVEPHLPNKRKSVSSFHSFHNASTYPDRSAPPSLPVERHPSFDKFHIIPESFILSFIISGRPCRLVLPK